MQYTPKYFIAQELVPPDIFNQRGDKSWQLIDDRLLCALDNLRRIYGPMRINDYHNGGTRSQSGLRTAASKYYRQFSQHSFGRAADILFYDVTTDEARTDILSNLFKFPEITALEMKTAWLHIDVRNSNFFTFNP